MRILELNPLFKTLTLACVFSCLLGLGTVFSGVTAFAHDAAGSHEKSLATTAKDAETAGNQETMKGFLLHAAAHLEIIPYNELEEFRKLLADDDQGIFMSGSVYVIIMDPEDGQVILHGADRRIEDRRLLSSEDTDNPDLKELRDGARNDKNAEGFCGEYMGKPACAVIYETAYYSAPDPEPFLLVVGYDFDRDSMENLQYSQLPGGDIVPQRRKAEDVTERAHLKEFVKDAIDAYFIDFLVKRHCNFSSLGFSSKVLQPLSPEQIKGLIGQLTSFGAGDVSLVSYCDLKKTLLFHPALRAEEGPWRADPIYLFAFGDTPEKESFFNALDKNLEDTELRIIDARGIDVGNLIVEKARASLEGGFVDYCWDNPSLADDNRRDQDGNPLPGASPGISWKTSYVVKSFSYLGFPPSIVDEKVNDIIVGSGIYPQEGEPPEGCKIFAADSGQPKPSSDDSGCAVAGTGSNLQGAALNLFLTVFALFLAVSFSRGRAGTMRGGSDGARS